MISFLVNVSSKLCLFVCYLFYRILLQITGDYKFALGSISLLMNDCGEIAIRNTSTVKNESQESVEILDKVLKNICPNDCSFNGNCSNGTCICADGFTAADCSMSIHQKPEIAK